jgi:hypothetical protein
VYLTALKEGIGDEGTVRIAEGLERNTSLKELDLAGVFCPHYAPFIFRFFRSFLVNDELFIAHLCH